MGTFIRRSLQVLLCAAALAGGAALAHATAGHGAPSESTVGVFPPPMPDSIPVRAVRRPTPPPPPHDTTPVAPPVGPFAESLANGMVIEGGTPHRLVLFTFDDGPDTRNTPRLLDTLDRYGIKAVFFLTASRLVGHGRWVGENKAIARDIVRRGHVVANHTFDHVQLPLLDEAGVRAQVDGAERVFEEVLGSRTWLIRPPGGARSPRIDALLAERGYTQVLWNLGTGDFQVRDPNEVFRIFKRVLERRERENGERGGVVLLHDTHAWSVDAVPLIVGWLRERNCELVAEGEELYDIVDDPSLFFVPRADASPSDIAPTALANPRLVEERQERLRIETRRRCSMLSVR